MSTTFWIFACAGAVMVATAPWDQPSYAHSWIDALYWGLAAFCALKTITSAMAPPPGSLD